MAEGEQGWTLFLMLICICVTLGNVIPIGYAFGVVNAPSEVGPVIYPLTQPLNSALQFINAWVRESGKSRYSVSFSDTQLTLMLSVIVSLFLIGGLIGSLCATPINSRLGRRGCLLLTSLLMIVAALCQLFCKSLNSIELLMLGRLIGGFAAALVYAVQPMFLVELAPAELSGSVGVFTCIGITGGIVVGQIFSFDFVFGNEQQWPLALAGGGIFVIMGLVPLVFFPESPRHLIHKDQPEAAKKALMRLRGDEARVNAEIAEIEVAEKNEGSLTMKQVLSDKRYTLPVFLISSYHFVQQMSGINAIWFYSVGIFSSAGFSMEVATWLNFMEGTLNFVLAVLAPVLMAYFNRRLLMMLSCIGSALFLTLLAVGLKLMDYQQEFSYACIVFLSLYIKFFNLALGPMPYFIGAELCESSSRPAAMALGSLFNWIANIILSMCFPILNSAIGPLSFLPSSVFCVCGFLITCRYLPETRKREIKDVAPLIENGFRSKVK
ncbi:hypothetical protein KR018_004962 [Drosophila ironensis]|nr:hypothetical protein KR018_004962 [Drosophila ironensis]